MTTLLNRLKNSGSVDVAQVLSESTFFNKRESIPTLLPVLNIAFGGSLSGGLVSGLTIFAGLSKSFKTLLALFCMRAYLDAHPNGVALFYDSEFGCTPDYLAANGIDCSRILHIPVEHVEQLKFDLVKRLEEIKRGDKVFILVDSLGNLASKKETEDALSEKSVADMSRAKAIRSLLRIITPHLTMKDLPCIVINHVYNTMELYSQTVIPGGCLLAGTKIRMYDDTEKNIEDLQVGDLVKTLEGAKPVQYIWNPDTLVEGNPGCLEIEFDDGYKVICSEQHPFLTNKGWVAACKLTRDHEITQIC